jgi:hypothetical protein
MQGLARALAGRINHASVSEGISNSGTLYIINHTMVAVLVSPWG